MYVHFNKKKRIYVEVYLSAKSIKLQRLFILKKQGFNPTEIRQTVS